MIATVATYERADTLPFLVWSADTHGRFTYRNRLAEDLLGTEGFAALPADDLPSVLPRWQHALRTGEPFHVEHRLKGRWYLLQAVAIRDADGHIVRWQGTGLDIDDRKRLEHQLAQIQTMLHAVIEANPDAMFVKDPNGVFLLANSASVEGLGTRSDKVVGRGSSVMLDMEAARQMWMTEQRVMQTGNTITSEESYRSEGQVRHLLTTKAPYRDAQGKIVGVIGVARDVTDRKQAEEALRASEERYRQLFDANPHPMWVYDAIESRFLAVNEAAIRHYGYSREEFLKKTTHDLSADIQVPSHALTGEVSKQRRHRLASGEIRQVEVASTPIDWGGRRARLTLAVDVTERKQLEDQLKQAQKLESIGQLAAGIAHEINTPVQYIGDNTNFLHDAFRDLGAIVGHYRAGRKADAERIAQEADVDYLLEEAPKAIGQTLDGVKHVARIVKAMKEFAHPGSEEKAAFDLNHALQNVITVTRNEWKYTADIVTELAPDLPNVTGLPGELNQVFLNLIVNAVHAIRSAPRAEGLKGTITITTRRDKTFVEVRIRDTGCGIPESIRGRIFDPFFTTKPVGQGTGQGLAIAHAVVVQRHGGSISVDSEVGKGTTFTVRFPFSGTQIQQSGTHRVLTAQQIAAARQARGLKG
jgi:PAS domain S-box-containing protein